MAWWWLQAEEGTQELRRKEEKRAQEKQRKRQELRRTLVHVWDLCHKRRIKLGPAFYAGADHEAQVEAIPTRDEVSGTYLSSCCYGLFQSDRVHVIWTMPIRRARCHGRFSSSTLNTANRILCLALGRMTC